MKNAYLEELGLREDTEERRKQEALDALMKTFSSLDDAHNEDGSGSPARWRRRQDSRHAHNSGGHEHEIANSNASKTNNILRTQRQAE